MILLPWVDADDLAWLTWCRPYVVEEGGWIRQTGPSTEYANRIADAWTELVMAPKHRGRPLTIIEHDIWPRRAEMLRLRESPDPVTVFPYDFARDLPKNWSSGLSVACGELDDWTSFSGIGLIRLSAEALEAIKLPAGFRSLSWERLDAAICRAVTAAGFRIRVLWPKVHHGVHAPEPVPA